MQKLSLGTKRGQMRMRYSRKVNGILKTRNIHRKFYSFTMFLGLLEESERILRTE